MPLHACAGFVVIPTVASPPSVVPFGDTRPVRGTQPVAFGFPTATDPLVIDMGTSACMATDGQCRARLGTPIPAGIALGPNGHPTTGAHLARQGTWLPFGGPEGGYQGFGLARAMDALGALSLGARPAGEASGALCVAGKPDVFLAAEDYRHAIVRRIDTVKAPPRQDRGAELRMPGARGFRTRARLLQEGIEIARKRRDALRRLSKGPLDHGRC